MQVWKLQKNDYFILNSSMSGMGSSITHHKPVDANEGEIQFSLTH